jgi:hypothetical protein
VIFAWIILFVVVCIVVHRLAGHALAGPPGVRRIGYVEGSPESVYCEACGGHCNRYRTLFRETEKWSEWICPRCVKGNY